MITILSTIAAIMAISCIWLIMYGSKFSFFWDALRNKNGDTYDSYRILFASIPFTIVEFIGGMIMNHYGSPAISFIFYGVITWVILSVIYYNMIEYGKEGYFLWLIIPAVLMVLGCEAIHNHERGKIVFDYPVVENDSILFQSNPAFGNDTVTQVQILGFEGEKSECEEIRKYLTCDIHNDVLDIDDRRDNTFIIDNVIDNDNYVARIPLSRVVDDKRNSCKIRVAVNRSNFTDMLSNDQKVLIHILPKN